MLSSLAAIPLRSRDLVVPHRCAEVFNPPACVTLWRLPEGIEEEFDARWEHWLDNAIDWAPFFRKLEGLQGSDLVEALGSFGIVNDRDVERLVKLRRSAEGRAVPLPGVFSGTDDDVALLAIGFARAEIGSLAVPYTAMSGMSSRRMNGSTSSCGAWATSQAICRGGSSCTFSCD